MNDSEAAPNTVGLLLILPQGPVVSGVTVWAVRLANELAAQGRAVGIILHQARPDHIPIDLPRHPAVEWMQTDLPSLDTESIEIDRVTRAYAASLASFQSSVAESSGTPIQCVLAPSLNHHTYAGAVAVQQALGSDQVRLLGWCHNDYGYDYALMQYYAPALAAVGCPSRRIHTELGRLLPTSWSGSGRLVHLPHAVPSADRLPQRPLLAASPQCDSATDEPAWSRPLRLVYTGRMDEPQKRVSELVSMAEMLAAKGVFYELRLIGDGPALEDVDRRLTELPNACRLDPVSPTELLVELDRADVFVLTSRYEAICLAMYEAMGRGCVPIVSRVSGVEEAINHGKTGLLYEAGSLDALCDLIMSLTDASLERMRNAAWSKVHEHHSMTAYAREVGDLVDHCFEPSDAPEPWPDSRPIIMPPGATASPDDLQRVKSTLRELLHSLRGHRIAIWGTGRHTESLIDDLIACEDIVCLIDDDPVRHGPAPSPWHNQTIIAPAEASSWQVTDIVISSAMHEQALFERRTEVAPARVHRLYGTDEDSWQVIT